MLNEIKGDI